MTASLEERLRQLIELGQDDNREWVQEIRQVLVDAEAEIVTLRQQLELFKKKARDWNEEADRYLAQRDELSVQLAASEAEVRRLREVTTALAAKWSDAAVWEHDDMGNVQSAQTFDQCAKELTEAVAPSAAGEDDQP